ncbi:MAG: YiiX/YebB-like N1pC/P60 family cysteine hydrolase [Bacteroidota bacterium]
MFIIRKTILHAIAPFARVANKINWRVGRGYKSRFETLQPHIGKLVPGMIILSHKDYELTNWFISGYWTHVAVIASENYVIEAVSKGVIKTRLKEFFSSIDDFIILEPAFCGRASMLKAVEYMEKYMGYPYNFNFLPSDRSFTCIDLVGRAYSLSGNIEKIKSASSAGFINYITREVILPENILNLENGWNIVYGLKVS